MLCIKGKPPYRLLPPTGSLVLAVFLLTSHTVAAQKNSQSKPDTISVPSWINALKNPNVNYFDAVNEFDNYWKDKEKPEEENELFEAAGDKEKKERLDNKKRHYTNGMPAVKYANEYKLFIWWKKESAGFVKPDGHIKSMNERIKEWRLRQEQKKDQEMKNRKTSATANQ